MNTAPTPPVDRALSLPGAPRRLNSPRLAAHAQADHADGDREGDRDQGEEAVDGLEGGAVGGVAEEVPDAGRPDPDGPDGRGQEQGGTSSEGSHPPMLRIQGVRGAEPPEGRGSTYREASSSPSVRAMLVLRISLVPSYRRMA